MDNQSLRELIRTVPDWPKPGVNFYDICSIMERPEAFAWTVNLMEVLCGEREVQAIVCPDARGFLWGAAVGFGMRLPVHLARKPGKLPGKLVTQSYEYEYSSASISMQADSELRGKRVILIDDVLATGGTALAIVELLTSHFGVAAADITFSAVLNLKFLPGEARLRERGVEVRTLVDFHE